MMRFFVILLGSLIFITAPLNAKNPTFLETNTDPARVADFSELPKKITIYVSFADYIETPTFTVAVGENADDVYPDNYVSALTELNKNDTHVGCKNNTANCRKFKFTVEDNEGYASKVSGELLRYHLVFTFKEENETKPAIKRSDAIKRDKNRPIAKVSIAKVSAADEQIAIKWNRPVGTIASENKDSDEVGGYVTYYWEADSTKWSARPNKLSEGCGKNGIQAISDATITDPKVMKGEKSFACFASCDFNSLRSNYSPLLRVDADASKDTAVLSNLTNKEQYVFITLYKDKAGLLSTAKTSDADSPACYSAIPTKTYSFNEFFELEDHDTFEDAYCFIATATYGSSSSYQVETFRTFRDQILRNSYLGELFIYMYYKYSPPLASLIAHSSVLRLTARLILYPIYTFAFLMVNHTNLILLISLAACLLLLGVTCWKFKSAFKLKSSKPLLTLLPLFFIGLPSQKLNAIDILEFNKEHLNYSYHLVVGLPEFSSYKQIKYDDGGGSSNEVSIFEALIGKPNALYQFSYEWYFFNKFGKLGLGGSAGIFSDIGNSVIQSGDGYQKLDEEVRLMMFPLGAYLTYHLDYLKESYLSPFVSYGFQEVMYRGKKGTKSNFNGNRKGFMWSAGVLINMDWMEPSAAANMELFYHIRNIHFVCQYTQYSTSPGISKIEDKSEAQKAFIKEYNIWNFGLKLEL